MATPVRSKGDAEQAGPAPPPPSFLNARTTLASRLLIGDGIEIGGLHQPLEVPPHARVRYVDRMTTGELRREYPELAEWDLVEVDIVDDGERLSTIAEDSQDFIVANHFLEHCENPIGTIETHLGKLKPGGVLFYAVPDKRYTFDFRRPVTPLAHMIADYEEGPERSRREHYEEWGRLVDRDEGESEEDRLARARQLEEQSYSIHFHVWTQAEFLKLVIACRERFEGAFDIEAAASQGIEYMVVLRKHGPPPGPVEPAPPAGAPAVGEWQRWKSRGRRALAALRRDVRRWRARR